MNNNFILMVSLTTAFCRLPAQQVYELDFQKCLAIAQNKCPDIQVLDENTAVPLKKM